MFFWRAMFPKKVPTGNISLVEKTKIHSSHHKKEVQLGTLVGNIAFFFLFLMLLCSCEKKSIEPKDCYGKWVPIEDKLSSKCIYLLEDGTVAFGDLNWNDVGELFGMYSMPNTGVWTMENQYENVGGILFMHGQKIHFESVTGGKITTGWINWTEGRLELVFLDGDPDNYNFIRYAKSASKLTAVSAQPLSVSPAFFDLGCFPAWKAQTQTFTIRNTGESTVNLLRMRSSCSCLAADFQPCTLEAGQETALTVTIPANSVSGDFSKTVFLETDVPGQEFLKLTVSGTAVPAVEVQPKREVYLGRLEAGKERVCVFRLIPASPEMKLRPSLTTRPSCNCVSLS